MFLQVSVCPQGGGVRPSRQTPPRQTPPNADGHCSGRYASYWNAFLFVHGNSLDFLVWLLFYFKFLKTSVLFVVLLIPLFWISGTSALGFKAMVDPLLGMIFYMSGMDSSDSVTTIDFFFLKKSLEDIRPSSMATDTPILDFW